MLRIDRKTIFRLFTCTKGFTLLNIIGFRCVRELVEIIEDHIRCNNIILFRRQQFLKKHDYSNQGYQL
jgi:hypothetical protein